MSHQKRHTLFLILALAVALFFVWYTAPRTAQELFPDFSWEQVNGMDGAYDRYEDPGHSALAPIWIIGRTTETITPDSEAGQALISLLKNVEYRRSLENLVPAKGVRSYGPLRPEDLSVYVRFLSDESPHYLMVEFDYDQMRLRTAESKEYICAATGQNYLAQAMFDLLEPLATEEKPEPPLLLITNRNINLIYY